MKTGIMLSAVAAMLLVAGTARAGDKAAKAAGDKTYFVTTTHTPEQCLSVLDDMAAQNKKLLSTTEWGCSSGDHTGYAFVQAASEDQALAQLPESSRASAKAVMVAKFTPEQLAKIHKAMAAKKSETKQ